MVLFESQAGVRMNPVPYKGSAPLMTDLAGGHVGLAVDLLPQVLPFIQSGKARALTIAASVDPRCCRMCPPRPKSACRATRCRPGMAWSLRPGRRSR
jgi:hypothetical protein